MGTPRPADARWWDHRRFGLLVQASTASVPAWAPVGQYAEWYRAHLQGDVSDTLLHPSPMVETIAHHRDRWAHVEHYEGGDFECNSTSGDVRIGLPPGRTLDVDLNTLSGGIRSDFSPEDGDGATARLRAKTVSGDITLLRATEISTH